MSKYGKYESCLFFWLALLLRLLPAIRVDMSYDPLITGLPRVSLVYDGEHDALGGDGSY